MARKPKIPPAVGVRARELRAGGRTREEVQRLLAAEGHKVSTGWISNAEAGPSSPAPEPAGAVAPAEVAALPYDAAPADFLPLLQRQVVALETLAAEAAQGKNLSGFTQVQRVLNTTVALIAKLRPPVPPDPEARPDMQAAAKRAREKLLRLVEKALRGAAA